jgi:uncharacterized protein
MKLPEFFPLTPVDQQIRDTDRGGDWCSTYTGRKFWHLDPKPGDFCLTDIVRGLSNECRWGSQIDFYSVAQHSLMVLHFVDLDTRGNSPASERYDALRWALLHDAAEAYMRDVPRPQKADWGAYKAAEVFVLEMLAKRFGIPTYGGKYPLPLVVHNADNDALHTEAKLLQNRNIFKEWSPPGRDRWEELPREWWQGPNGKLWRWDPERAMEFYLSKFEEVFEMTPAEFIGEADFGGEADFVGEV